MRDFYILFQLFSSLYIDFFIIFSYTCINSYSREVKNLNDDFWDITSDMLERMYLDFRCADTSGKIFYIIWGLFFLLLLILLIISIIIEICTIVGSISKKIKKYKNQKSAIKSELPVQKSASAPSAAPEPKPEPPPKPKTPKRTMNISDIKNIFDITKYILEDIGTYDSDFNDEKFSAYSKKVITLYLSALTQKDASLIEPFETEDLFFRHKTQIDEYIRNQKTLVIENINIKNLLFVGDYTEKEYRYVSTFVYITMNRYTIDNKTKEVVKDDPKTTYVYKYMMNFTKELSSVPESTHHTDKCQNCGAPITNNNAKYCEYCGSDLQENNTKLCFDGWKLYDLTEYIGDVTFSLSNVKLPFKL